MAASPFEALPPEIFEGINVLLSLRDLSNVRVVSCSMASKATQDRFASFVRSRSVELTRPALETMAALTAEGRIGCFIEDLTIAGVVYNTAGLQHQLQAGSKTTLGRGCEASGMLDDKPTEPATDAELSRATAALDTMQSKQADYDQLHEAGGDIVALLAGIFQNIAANTKRRGLASLSLWMSWSTARTLKPHSRPLTGWPGDLYGTWQNRRSTRSRVLSVRLCCRYKTSISLQ
jgi:hypothetical protein